MMVLALMTTVACQKDYYLADLEAAEFRIETLNNSVAQLSDELSASLASLANSERMVNDLNTEREVLVFNIEELQALLNSKNEEIVNLINDAEASDEEILTLSTEITSLNDAILIAEDKIVELATDLQDAVDNPEIVYVYVTEYVEVEVAAAPVVEYVVQVVENPINTELEAQVAELQAMIADTEEVDAKIADLQSQLVDADVAKQEAVEKAASDLADLQDKLNAALAHDVVDDALIASLQATILELQGDVSSLQTQVLSLEGQIAILQTNLATANTNLEATQTLLDEANFGVAEKQAAIDVLEAKSLSLTASLTAAIEQGDVDAETIASLQSEIADLNSDATDYKNAIESLQGVITSLTTELTQTKTSLSTTEATLATVEGEKADLQATYDALVITNETLEDQLAAALEVTDTDEEAIADLNAQITDFKAEVLSLETQVNNLTLSNEELEAQNAALQLQVDTLTSDLATANTNLAEVTASLATSELNLATQKDLAATLSSTIAGLNAEINNLEEAEVKDQESIDELNAKVVELNGEITALGVTIANLEGQVAGLTTDLGTANDSLEAANTKIAGLEGDNSELQDLYDALLSSKNALDTQLADALAEAVLDEAKIAELEAQVAALNVNITDLNTQIDGLETDVADLEEANAALQVQVDALTSELATTSNTLSEVSAKLAAAEGDNAELTIELQGYISYAETLKGQIQDAKDADVIDAALIVSLQANVETLNSNIAELNAKIDGLETDVACNTPESTSSTFSTWLPAYNNNTETFTQEAVETVTEVFAEDCGKDNVVTTLYVTREIVVTVTSNNVSSNEFSIKQDVNGDGDMLDDVTNVHTTYASSLGTTYSSSPWVIETNHTDCTPVITEVPAGDVFLPVYDSAIHDETFTQTKSSFKTYTYNELCDEETYTEETVIESQVITISYTTVESSPLAEPYTNLDVNGDGDKLDFYREVTTTKHVTGQPDEVLGVTYLIETNN